MTRRLIVVDESGPGPGLPILDLDPTPNDILALLREHPELAAEVVRARRVELANLDGASADLVELVGILNEALDEIERLEVHVRDGHRLLEESAEVLTQTREAWEAALKASDAWQGFARGLVRLLALYRVGAGSGDRRAGPVLDAIDKARAKLVELGFTP